PITVMTATPGQSIVLDSATLTSPQTVNWVPGSTHSIGVPAASGGVRYHFISWSDGGAQTHTITVPASAASYTATATPQYLLTLHASPAAGGTISPNPASPGGDGYYDSGTPVLVTATANSGYQFTGFSGALTGTANPQSVTMNAPATVTANFSTK